MSLLWKKIELYKGKSNCKLITIAAWGLGQRPGGLSRGKAPNVVGLFNTFKTIKHLTMALKNYTDSCMLLSYHAHVSE